MGPSENKLECSSKRELFSVIRGDHISIERRESSVVSRIREAEVTKGALQSVAHNVVNREEVEKATG